MASTSTSLETSEEIKPYQFEPVRNNEDEWTDCSSSEGEDDDNQPESLLSRCDVEADSWCKCGNYQKQYLPTECVCCEEVDGTKKLLEESDLSKCFQLLFVLAVDKYLMYI